MFHKALQNRTPASPATAEPQSRVTHKPGSYPALQTRSDKPAHEPAFPLPSSTNKTNVEHAPALTPLKAIESESPSRLVVGPEVKLKGAEILDCDTLIVEGRVEATMDSRVLRINGQGSFVGKVSIDIAEIHGYFEGELTARDQLIIHATGRVKGTIRYGSLLIEAGGQISGDVQADIGSNESSKTHGKEVERAKVSLVSAVA